MAQFAEHSPTARGGVGDPESDPLHHRNQALSLVHTCDFSPVDVEAGELQVEVG